MKVAVVPLYVTVPVTAVPAAFARVKLAEVSVEAIKVSLAVAVSAALIATPAAMFAGLVLETVGAVVSEGVAVVVVPPPHAARDKTNSVFPNLLRKVVPNAIFMNVSP